MHAEAFRRHSKTLLELIIKLKDAKSLKKQFSKTLLELIIKLKDAKSLKKQFRRMSMNSKHIIAKALVNLDTP
jgi:hypothetical protein